MCAETNLTQALQIYLDVQYLKRMIGIVIGLFCVLAVAGLCSYCFKQDLTWYNLLIKPSFVLEGRWFTAFISVCYMSCVLTISRLVEFRHLFPSMIFFLLLGASSVLFTFLMFTQKSLVGALICAALILGFAYTLFFRFLIKDIRLAACFLPTFIFDAYAFICALSVAMLN